MVGSRIRAGRLANQSYRKEKGDGAESSPIKVGNMKVTFEVSPDRKAMKPSCYTPGLYSFMTYSIYTVQKVASISYTDTSLAQTVLKETF